MLLTDKRILLNAKFGKGLQSMVHLICLKHDDQLNDFIEWLMSLGRVDIWSEEELNIFHSKLTEILLY